MDTYDSERAVDALKTIDNNKQGFAIVMNVYRIVFGVLTYGEVRRGLIARIKMTIARIKMTEAVSKFYTRNAIVMIETADFKVILELLFKNQAIKFLPIVDEEGRIVNIITKN